MEIVQIELESDEAKQLLLLLNSEWCDFTEFERCRSGLSIPRPIAALQEGRVLGGASFTTFMEPNGSNIVVWLNALYVIPESRDNGVASKLVEFAKHISPKLYALTDIPKFYTQLGWKVSEEVENGTVVCT
jgi:GNAT superfamily N-acetyltransferase